MTARLEFVERVGDIGLIKNSSRRRPKYPGSLCVSLRQTVATPARRSAELRRHGRLCRLQPLQSDCWPGRIVAAKIRSCSKTLMPIIAGARYRSIISLMGTRRILRPESSTSRRPAFPPADSAAQK